MLTSAAQELFAVEAHMVGGLVALCHEAFSCLKIKGLEFELPDEYFGK